MTLHEPISFIVYMDVLLCGLNFNWIFRVIKSLRNMTHFILLSIVHNIELPVLSYFTFQVPLVELETQDHLTGLV